MTGVENPLSALDEVLDISLDFMGLQAKRDLKIHRNEFREDFSLEEYIVRYLQLYFHSSLEHSGEYDMKMRLLQMLYLPDSDMDILGIYRKKFGRLQDRFD